jgi:hypothetical protein
MVIKSHDSQEVISERLLLRQRYAIAKCWDASRATSLPSHQPSQGE